MDKEYFRNYRLKNYKKGLIYGWLYNGLKSNYLNAIYCKFMNSTKCEKCGHDYSYYKKCMDHCHSTGEFRAILCQSCNSNEHRTDNSSGVPNVSFDKSKNRWVYQKRRMKNHHTKKFRTKQEAIEYKYQYEQTT